MQRIPWQVNYDESRRPAYTLPELLRCDLYDNCLELNELTSDGYRKLGYLSRFGFQREETRKEDFVINGTASEWIGLRNILGPGKKHLAIRSLHQGDFNYVNTPFYSFIEVEVAKSPGQAEYRIQFLNELEKDRSFLHFDLNFSE